MKGSHMKGLTRVRWFAYAVAVSLAFAAPAGQFRSLTVTTQTTYGSVTAFDLAIGPSAGTNPLYIAWGASDGGETTAGWDHVEKLQDVGPAATSVSVPISRLPEWGTDACKAVRFLFLPGDMYVPLQNFKTQGAMISADYRMNSRDEARCVFKLTTVTSQYGAHLFGYKKNLANQFYCCYAGGAQMAGGVCYNGGQGNFKTTGTVYAYQSVVCEAVVSAAEVSFYTNGVLHQQSTTGYSGDEFTVNGDCTLFHSEDYVPQSGKPYLNTYFYSFTVTRDGERMIDFIPCKTNGVVCVYDAARQRFFGTTNGTFTAGLNVEGAAASSLVAWREAESPSGTFAFSRLTDSTERISGEVLSLGEGAESADVYLAYAPQGETLPAPVCIATGILKGGTFSYDVTGLVAGTAYDYEIYYGNNLSIPQTPSVTGSFNAFAQIGWTGEVSSDWFDAANWDKARIPAALDDVMVPAGATLLLTNETPALHAIEVAGVLTAANWTTKIVAGTVTVANGGTVTCEGPFTDAEMSNRVWIVCTDLTVDAGGAINVNDKGYAAGFGPGRSPTTWIGASHGGFGGGPCNSASRRMLSCDDVEDPVQPGSGGNGGKNSSTGTPGGGVVRIEATGTVTVNGSILASATLLPAKNDQNSYGAGGSISISCARFAGADGVVRADAAVSGYSSPGHLPPTTPVSYCGGSPGGGGRISIRTSAQEDGLISGMTLSVLEGFWSLQNTKRNNQDSQFNNADLGTIWINDARLLESLGTKISGKIYGIDSLSLDNLTISSGHVRFSEDGFKLSVAGDLVVQGESARLEIGGAIETNRVYDINFIGFEAPELTVGGNFSILEGARFDVWSSVTNDGQSVGAKVTVGGTLTVGGSSSRLVVSCDEVNGGAPKFSVGSFEVDEGGIVTADGRGFGGGTSTGYGTEKSYKGKGPGGGNRIGNSGNVGQNKYIGGGYGGIGGWSVTGGSTSGLSYGDEWRPSLPGSGGAGQSWTSVAGAGGGVIDVTATTSIRIDGTVSANGWRRYFDDVNVGGGSGGSIWLKTPVFSGAATGVISANGQDRSNVFNGGAGGGGRIAIWTGSLPYDGKVTKSRVHKQATAFTMPDGTTYAGAISAAGGTNPKEESGDADGADGTCWFVDVDKPKGLMLLVR